MVAPLCAAVLDLLPSILEGTDQWALMGGTGLAEYHLGHRLSDDLDLFTMVDGAVGRLAEALVSAVPARLGGVSVSVSPMSPDLRRLRLARGEGDTIRIDLIRDPAPRFEAASLVDGVPIGSITDIAVGKLGALIARDEPRDLVDLWAIERLGEVPISSFYRALFEKDPGLAAYPRAIADAWQRHASRAFWPPMVIHAPVNEDLRAFCRSQEEALMRFLRKRAGSPPGT